MFNWLLGGSKTAEKAVDLADASVRGIGNWIDEQQYTEEEKAKAKAETAKQYHEFVKMAYDQNSIRSLTRRGLAWAFAGAFLFSFLTSVGLAIAGQHKTADVIIGLIKVYWLGEIMIAIIAFYFGNHLLQSRGK